MSVVVICQKEVQAPEGRHLHLLRGQRRSDREREEREMKGSAITRPVHLGEVSRQVNMIVMDDPQGKEAERCQHV